MCLLEDLRQLISRKRKECCGIPDFVTRCSTQQFQDCAQFAGEEECVGRKDRMWEGMELEEGPIALPRTLRKSGHLRADITVDASLPA
eukprot:3778137-Rhodomonas_salina.3